jgi:predicted nucleic acid-binding protein
MRSAPFSGWWDAVRAVDATFPIDVLKAHPGARARAESLAEGDELLAIPAAALAEVLVGAYYKGGALLEATLSLLNQFEVLVADKAVAHEAGRLGAELRRRGEGMSASDLLVAASCRVGNLTLISRDEAFGRVPGLAVERY